MPDNSQGGRAPNGAFVYIVESPNPEDMWDGRTEGNILCEHLRIANLLSWYRVAVNSERFEMALGWELVAAVEHYDGALPLLHISAHGNEEGIQLTDNEFYSWEKLRNLISPINDALQGNLVISMSTCEGMAAMKMAFVPAGNPPFRALVGPHGKVRWNDSIIAFLVFYHRLFAFSGIENAVQAMRLASNDDTFDHIEGSKAQETFAAALESTRRQLTLQKLTELYPPAVQPAAPPPE